MAASTATEKLILRMGPSASRPVMDIGEPFFDTDTETFGVGNGTPNPPLALSSSGKQLLSNKMWIDAAPSSTYNSGSGVYSITLDAPYLTSLREGLVVRWIANAANNGASKLQINNFSSVDLVSNVGAALQANDVKADMVVEVMYKNGVARILNLGGGGSNANVGSTGTNSNTFSIGDGQAGNKRLVANTNAANKPFVQYNDVNKYWEYSNNGVNTMPIGGQLIGTDFDPSLTGVAFYTATTSAAPAWTAPGTSNRRYIVRSIMATNIGSQAAEITSEVAYAAGGPNIALAWSIPVPVGMSVELLWQPKVFQPADILNARASVAGTIQLTVTYAEVSDTSLYGVGVDLISTNLTDLRVAGMDYPEVIESILVANDDGASPVDVKIAITNSSNVVQGYLIYNFTVEPKATVEVLDQPKFLPAGYKLRAEASTANRAEISVSGRIKN